MPGYLEPEVLEDVKKSTQAIRRRSDGLLQFTEAYRQLTKIPPPRFEQTDPAQLLDRVLHLFSPQWKEFAVEIIRNYPPTPLTALMDPNLMEQVFINLVKNALEAMNETVAPRLGVTITKEASGLIEIAIADNGPGIPDDLLPQIFVPFFTTKQEGSGIGLSLSRQIVHLHKGQIQVISEAGRGSCFVVRI